ncbi:IS3 family transposase [Spirosoma pomorum]
MSLSQRRALVDLAAPGSLREQCQWVGLHRSAYYYQPVAADTEDLLLMRLLDEQYLLTPFHGYRKMQLVLTKAGYLVNHKRVRRLMQLIGIETIYARINTSKPAVGHRIYPYLLRGLTIDRVHQVWATDITYVPMQTGYMYLMAIIDLHSRYVLKWSVSNTMAVEWCSRVLSETLATYPTPAIFNTDQGSQFTADVFTALLLKANVQISMDGKGRALDNIFVERLWRTVKYEDIYLKAYADGWQLEAGLRAYFEFYNCRRFHQALAYQTPEQVLKG